ncbi:MAG: acyltransferase [Verrucomicrobiota bacterium]
MERPRRRRFVFLCALRLHSLLQLRGPDRPRRFLGGALRPHLAGAHLHAGADAGLHPVRIPPGPQFLARDAAAEHPAAAGVVFRTRAPCCPFNGVAWSLSVEAFFYLCFPWMAGVLRRRGPMLLMTTSFAVGFGLVALATLITPARPAGLAISIRSAGFSNSFSAWPHAAGWLAGGVRAPAPAAWLAAEVLVLAVSLASVVGIPVVIQLAGLSDATTQWIGAEVCAVTFAALIWTFAHQAGALSRLLSASWLRRLGEISFSIYMSHQFVMRVTDCTFMDETWEALAYFPPYLALTLAISTAMFLLVGNAGAPFYRGGRPAPAAGRLRGRCRRAQSSRRDDFQTRSMQAAAKG